MTKAVWAIQTYDGEYEGEFFIIAERVTLDVDAHVLLADGVVVFCNDAYDVIKMSPVAEKRAMHSPYFYDQRREAVKLKRAMVKP